MKCMAAARLSSSEIRADVWLDVRRSLWLASVGVLVVSDIHWGYVASHRSRGNLLPKWGDTEIGDRLQSLIKDYNPTEMIWLGDSIHALPGRESAERFIKENAATPISVVGGNHDSRWKRAVIPTLERGGYFLHHGHREIDTPRGLVEIIGHYHPAVSWDDGAGGRLKIPALVDSPRRIILPAFSPWSAGTPWNGNLRADERLWGISKRRIFQIPLGAERNRSGE